GARCVVARKPRHCSQSVWRVLNRTHLASDRAFPALKGGYRTAQTGSILTEAGGVKTMEDIIRGQRGTVKEHIDQENAHDWPAVYDTFAHNSAIHAVPFHAEFGGLNGIKNFYQAVDTAFPDFKATVWGECDAPGCSVREIAVEGTHKGEWCGVAATGRRGKGPFCVVYLFGKGDHSRKLLGERRYFDNVTVMKQINGDAEVASVPEFGDSQMAVAR